MDVRGNVVRRAGRRPVGTPTAPGPPSETSSRTARALAAIAARNSELNAFLAIRPEAASEEGIPLGVKDIFDTAGLVTTYGSCLYRDHLPVTSAEAVLRLQGAGYVLIGKTNLHEFAYGITSENPHFGAVRNPRDPSRMAGGSSGGSAAALAAGLCDAALGSDTGGSIRIPAAFCGVVGFKPTYGVVPTQGLFPLAPSFDHAGPMARDVKGCAAAFAVLADQEVASPADPAMLRVGSAEAFFEVCAPGVGRACRRALRGMGPVLPVSFPSPDAFSTAPMFLSEAAALHRATFPSRAAEYGPDVAGLLRRGLAVPAVDYLACREELQRFRARAAGVFAHVDLLAVPTVPCVAPLLGTASIDVGGRRFSTRDLLTRNTRPFANLGWPALALPCGIAEDGLPASLSLVGPPGGDARVLAAGLALEALLAAEPG
ncbi:MAG: amidase [Gemmatimonadetes bacterium]|nr:amidase [Gemmatimonadota bacterium]